MTDNEMIGARIRDLRKKRSITQQALGEMLNVKKSTVSDWEIGKRSFSMNLLKRIAAVLEVDVWEIIEINDIEFDGQTSELSREEQDLMATYRALDEPGRKVVRAVAELEFERRRDELSGKTEKQDQ